MKEACLDFRISEVSSEEDEEMGYFATKLILSQSDSITAIFAGDDAAARGAYKAAKDSGLSIPDDVSIVGFSDTSEASALYPPLTSIRVFPEQIGKQLAEQLLKRIARPDLSLEATVLPTQLVKRESCSLLLPNRPSISTERSRITISSNCYSLEHESEVFQAKCDL
jgi:DNA-binding LacI/PurR family transcriptional regulator